MNNQRPDVIEMLETEQKYHIEQLRRINIALAALRGETDLKPDVKQSTSKTIPWTAKVMKIIDEASEPLSLNQVCQKLSEKGIGEALSPKCKPVIYSTLARGVKKGILEKAGHGVYRKRHETLRKPVLLEGGDT